MNDTPTTPGPAAETKTVGQVLRALLEYVEQGRADERVLVVLGAEVPAEVGSDARVWGITDVFVSHRPEDRFVVITAMPRPVNLSGESSGGGER